MKSATSEFFRFIKVNIVRDCSVRLAEFLLDELREKQRDCLLSGMSLGRLGEVHKG
jgi:hypothetical protein